MYLLQLIFTQPNYALVEYAVNLTKPNMVPEISTYMVHHL